MVAASAAREGDGAGPVARDVPPHRRAAPHESGMLLIRSADLQSAPTIVRSEVQAIEPDIVVWRLMPLETWMEQSRWAIAYSVR